MDIQWHGLSCFSFKGKNATFVVDPYDTKQAGMKLPKLDPDFVLSNVDFPLHRGLDSFHNKEMKVFDWPGEYEAKGVIVQGVSAYDRPKEKEDTKKDDANRVILYFIKCDGFTICHLSNLGHKLTPEMLEVMGSVDILIIPVGGSVCLDAKKAHEVIEQIDPRIVIPMYYHDLEPFLKEVGLNAPTREKVLKFQLPSQLPQEKTEFRILEPVLG